MEKVYNASSVQDFEEGDKQIDQDVVGQKQ